MKMKKRILSGIILSSIFGTANADITDNLFRQLYCLNKENQEKTNYKFLGAKDLEQQKELTKKLKESFDNLRTDSKNIKDVSDFKLGKAGDGSELSDSFNTASDIVALCKYNKGTALKAYFNFAKDSDKSSLMELIKIAEEKIKAQTQSQKTVTAVATPQRRGFKKAPASTTPVTPVNINETELLCPAVGLAKKIDYNKGKLTQSELVTLGLIKLCLTEDESQLNSRNSVDNSEPIYSPEIIQNIKWYYNNWKMAEWKNSLKDLYITREDYYIIKRLLEEQGKEFKKNRPFNKMVFYYNIQLGYLGYSTFCDMTGSKDTIEFDPFEEGYVYIADNHIKAFPSLIKDNVLKIPYSLANVPFRIELSSDYGELSNILLPDSLKARERQIYRDIKLPNENFWKDREFIKFYKENGEISDTKYFDTEMGLIDKIRFEAAQNLLKNEKKNIFKTLIEKIYKLKNESFIEGGWIPASIDELFFDSIIDIWSRSEFLGALRYFDKDYQKELLENEKLKYLFEQYKKYYEGHHDYKKLTYVYSKSEENILRSLCWFVDSCFRPKEVIKAEKGLTYRYKSNLKFFYKDDPEFDKICKEYDNTIFTILNNIKTLEDILKEAQEAKKKFKELFEKFYVETTNISSSFKNRVNDFIKGLKNKHKDKFSKLELLTADKFDSEEFKRFYKRFNLCFHPDKIDILGLTEEEKTKAEEMVKELNTRFNEAKEAKPIDNKETEQDSGDGCVIV